MEEGISQSYEENYSETDGINYSVEYKYAGFWIRFLTFLLKPQRCLLR